jgi:nicotinamide mononucleotide transporter PnuC
MLDFWTKLTTEASVFNTLEITAVVSALAYVILASKGNRWCFLFGLISSAIYIYITYQLNFFFDVGINCYYIIMSFYGWFAWSNQANETKLIVKNTETPTPNICIVRNFTYFNSSLWSRKI